MERLQQFIAGLRANGINNLHVRDTDHTDHTEYQTLARPEIIDAVIAGGFANGFYEAGDPGQNSAVNPNAPYQLYYPEARHQLVSDFLARQPDQATITRYRHQLDMLTQAFAGIPNVSKEQLQARWTSQFSDEIRSGQLPASIPDNVVSTYRSIAPGLYEIIISPEGNARTIENMRERARQRPGGNLFVYGASHMNNDGLFSGNLDLDTVFPGYNIVILRDHNDRFGGNGDLESEVALNGDDDPEFIIYLSGRNGRLEIEDLRSEAEKTRLPLNTILASGSERLQARSGRGQEPSMTPADDAPETPVEEAGSVTGESTEESDENQNNNQDLPWWSIIGAGIGAWLTSSIGGGGFGSIISMLIGGLLGWVFGGAVGGNHGNPFEGILNMINGNGGRQRERDGETQEQPREAETPAPATYLSPQALANTLAFAHVESVSGTLPVSQANPADILDAPANFLVPFIAEQALNKPL